MIQTLFAIVVLIGLVGVLLFMLAHMLMSVIERWRHL